MMRGAIAVLVAALALGCGHARPTAGASPQHQRERRVVLGEGVLVEATRWDATLVESAASEIERADRQALRDRLRARYVEGVTAFTVVVELRDRPGGTQGLDRPEAWWFEIREGSRHDRAARVELVAVDRFPAGTGRAHLRIALDVTFTGHRDGEVDLHVGTVRPAGRRAELGATLAQRGALLHWDSAR
jgi:hypothetical protein